MIKRLVFCLILLFPAISWGDPANSTIGQFKTSVRAMIGIEDNVILPDTTLTTFVKKALTWAAVDIGGRQAQYRIVTAELQSFYQMPDSICEILTVSYLTETGEPRSIRLVPSEFYEATGGSQDAGLVPTHFNYWADTIEVMPFPSRTDDTIVIKAHIEYSIAVITSADSSTIQLKSGYVEAAEYYCAYLAMIGLKNFDDASQFFTMYERSRASLRERYNGPFTVRAQ